jgi:hypothetical protein
MNTPANDASNISAHAVSLPRDRARPRRAAALLALALAALAPAEASAGAEVVPARGTMTPPPGVSSFHGDFEIDPTAYALGGFSLHVGLGWKRLRVDLGNYAMGLPQALSGTRDFDVSFDGYGAKAQLFLFSDEQRGGFVGVDGGVTRMSVRRDETDLTRRQSQVGLGVNLGWRFAFGDHFYATPWIGFGYAFGAKDVTLEGATYTASRVTIFPAVHLGYRFQ